MQKKTITQKRLIILLAVALFLLALPLTKVMGQTGETWSVCLEGTCDFDTIQSAIDAASNGDTILVGPGTYAEEITLNKPNITVRSTAGAATTIIAPPVGDLTTGVWAVAEMGSLTFEGFTVSNFTENGIIQKRADHAGTEFHVWNNIIIPYDDYLRNGIQVSGDGSSVIGNTIYGERLTDDWSSSAIIVVNASNVEVSSNTVVGGDSGVDIGICIKNSSGTVDTISVTNNTISDAESAITIEGSSNNISNVSINGNDLGNGIMGINVQTVTLETVIITNNDFHDNSTLGLRFSETSATVTGATITGNTFIKNGFQIWGGLDGQIELASVLASNTFDKAVTIEGGTMIFSSIQEAIETASVGDTIEVADGTYDYESEGISPESAGMIKVTKPLTIQAADDGNDVRPVIDGTGIDGAFKIWATTFTGGQVVIEGFEITGDSTTDIAITAPMHDSGDPTKIIVRDNIIHGMNGGIDLWGSGSFDAEKLVNNVEITNNEFYDLGQDGAVGFGIMLEDLKDDAQFAALVEHNLFRDIYNGSDDSGVGIVIPRADAANGETVNVRIAANTFESTVSLGVAVLAGDAAPVEIVNNTFAGAGLFVENISSGPINALSNWWASETGPEAGQVVGSAKYNPWCYTADCTELYLAETGLIQDAVDVAAAGETIHVAPGTYVEGITQIDKDVTIIGTGSSKPIITPAEDTGTANEIGSSGRGWFQIHNGATVNFENLVFDGTGRDIYTAVHYHEDSAGGSVENCDFANIRHSQYQGRGINNYGQHLDVIGCTFSNIERIGVFTYNLTAETYVSNCTYTGKGAGEVLDYGVEIGGGSHAEISNNTITGIGESTSGWGSAAILVTDAYPAGSPAAVIITDNTLTDNHLAIRVGYGASDGVIVEAHGNNFSNTYWAIYTTTDLVNLVDGSENWWGSSGGADAYQVVGKATSSPWCGDEACTTMLPNDEQEIELPPEVTEEDVQIAINNAPSGATVVIPPGSYTTTNGFVINSSGVTVYLREGVNIQNNSPCFVVTADDITVKAETLGRATCVPTDGSNGIDVNAGLTNITIEGFEIDGSGQTTGDGINVAGAVTNLVIRDMYIHDLDGDGIDVVAPPTGTVEIKGNLFMDNAGIGIRNDAGTSDLNATYNAWGDVAGPTSTAGDGVGENVAYDPWTHVDLYLESSGTVNPDEVENSERITYTVYANLENVMGMAFTLKYPSAYLTYIESETVLSDNFDDETLTPNVGDGTLTFQARNTTTPAESGEEVALFMVTFEAGEAAGTYLLDLDETTDTFTMQASSGSSDNIYATELVDSNVTVMGLFRYIFPIFYR